MTVLNEEEIEELRKDALDDKECGMSHIHRGEII